MNRAKAHTDPLAERRETENENGRKAKTGGTVVRRPRINIRKLRAVHQMTQRQLAGRMGVAVTTVVQWDRGAQPSAPMLPQMAGVFGCSIEELYDTGPEHE